MTRKRRILCPLSVVMIAVALFNASGTTILLGSQTASSDLILTVQAERPYYGFGEVVRIRGNLTDTNGTAIQDAKIAIEVKNPRNNTIFLDIVFSSLNGTYGDNLRLDENTALGGYYVYVTANAAGYQIAINQTVFTVLTMANLSETSFIESTLNETLLMHQTTMNGVAVSGNLTGTLNFTCFEMVNITTGSFAGKGFSKGGWKATLEGILYEGNWRGMLFLKPSERKIYLKGAISGEISGIAEACISETVNGSGVYDRYEATWKIGSLRATIISATLNLNGTVVYLSSSEFPNTGLYVLQTSIEGSAIGHYDCSLSSTLTHVRISTNSPYIGEGFSIISYSSNYGMGEGWTYHKLASPGIVELKGFLTRPLYGIIYATLNETTLPRSLRMYVERVDLGLPPMADLKLKIWGPERASPGQTITYDIELRNDGLKSAENITLVYLPPLLSDFFSASLPYSYDDVVHVVRWDFENIFPKTIKYLSIRVRIFWELPHGIMLAHSASTYPKEIADEILWHDSPKLTEKQKIVLDVIETVATSIVPDALGIPLSITMFLGEQPLTPAILSNALRARKAAIDFRFEEAEYRQAIATLLYNLQEDPEYLKRQDKSFRQAIEELAEICGYTPPKGATEITVARDPNVKYGPAGYVSLGQTLNYTVEYENEGEGIAFGVYFTDTLDEDLDDSTLEIGPVISKANGSVIAEPGTYNPAIRTITWLVGEVGPGEGGLANFTVKVKNGLPDGTEIINFATVYFPSVPETTRTNTIVSVVGEPQIIVKDVAPLEPMIAKGATLYINVTLANEGYFAETFNITLYANSTIIKTQNITMPGKSEDAIIFAWNTTSFSTGNYTISAYAWPVPDETDTDDNLYVDGTVQIAGNWTTSFVGSGGYPIVDFAVYNGKLYAASDNTLYTYDGSSWNVTDAPTYVLSLEPYEDKLIIGGKSGLYSYNGTTFTLIFNLSTYIKPLGVYNNMLYAGTVLGKPPTLYYCNGSAENPANWHKDTAFSTILNFSGPFGSIDSFAAYNDKMYVSCGGTVYSYNGSEWSIAKTYDDVCACLDMKVYNDKLYLATRDQAWRKPIYQGGLGFSGRVIEFNGESWTTILDHDYWIFSLETYDNKLYAGTANNIFTYNGTDWNLSFNTTEGAYYAISLITYDGKIYAGMGNGYIFADPSSRAKGSETVAVPEFPSFIILPLLMLTMLVVVLMKKKKRVS